MQREREGSKGVGRERGSHIDVALYFLLNAPPPPPPRVRGSTLYGGTIPFPLIARFFGKKVNGTSLPLLVINPGKHRSKLHFFCSSAAFEPKFFYTLKYVRSWWITEDHASCNALLLAVKGANDHRVATRNQYNGGYPLSSTYKIKFI